MNETHNRKSIPLYIAVCLFIHTALVLAAPYISIPGTSNSQFYIILLSYAFPGYLALSVKRRFGIRHERPTGGPLSALPLFFILLAAMILLSSLTAWLMELCGVPVTGGEAASGNFLSVILLDCCLPAAMEELFFRLMLLTLLLQCDRKNAVWINALLFALIHPSLYQIPYAFCGGIILALTARVAGPFTALAFHFANNLASVLLSYGEAWGGAVFNAVVLPLIALAAILSVIWLVRHRDDARYAPIAEFFSRTGGERPSLSALFSPIGVWCVFAFFLTLLNTVF